MAKMVSGTTFAPDPDVIKVFDTYVLDGQQHMIQGSAKEGVFYDLSTKGREFVRAPYGNLRFPSRVYTNSLNCSYFLDSERGEEYKTFIMSLESSMSLASSRHASAPMKAHTPHTIVEESNRHYNYARAVLEE